MSALGIINLEYWSTVKDAEDAMSFGIKDPAKIQFNFYIKISKHIHHKYSLSAFISGKIMCTPNNCFKIEFLMIIKNVEFVFLFYKPL